MPERRAARHAARSRRPKSSGTCGAPQYHFDAGNRYTGQFYEQSTGRGIVAWKGQVVRTEKGKNPRLLATLGEPAVIDSYYKPNDWNELHIIAIGNQMTHILNGHVLSVLIDEDPTYLRKSGAIGLEVEADRQAVHQRYLAEEAELIAVRGFAVRARGLSGNMRRSSGPSQRRGLAGAGGGAPAQSK